ncbi:aminotransferase class V-fold PLP-dependent enzyme, partial [Staphylococcus aureus]
AGTTIIAQAIELAEAIRNLESIGFDAIHKYEQEITICAYYQMSAREGSEIYGRQKDRRAGVITYKLQDVHTHDVAT